MTAFDPAAVWVAIAVLAAGTYALRASFLLGAGLVSDLPPPARDALELVPVAVLAGLVAPALVLVDGSLALGAGNPRVLAGGLAVVVAWRTESLLLTVGVGMGALWVLQWLVGLG